MFPEGRLFEFLIAAIVALIVVGPKDLPVLLRKFGQFMARVRAMAAEFRASFDEMARQSELDELRKEVEAMRHGQFGDIATHAPEVNQTFDEISQGLSDVGVQLNAPVAYPYTPAQTSAIEIAEAPKPKRARKAPAKTAAAKSATAKKSAVAKPSAKAAAPKRAVAPKKAAAPPATPKSKPAAKAKPSTSKVTAPARPRTRKATVS